LSAFVKFVFLIGGYRWKLSGISESGRIISAHPLSEKSSWQSKKSNI